MQVSKPLLWLITILWFLAGIFWYRSCNPCRSCAESTTDTTTMEPGTIALPGFSIQSGDFSYSSPSNFKFGISTPEPSTGDFVSGVIDSLANYLAGHPDQSITITGSYGPDEKNNTSFGDLGLARADAIKQLLVAKGIDASRITAKSILGNGLVFQPSDTLVGGIAMDIDAAAPTPTTEPQKSIFEPRTIHFNTGKSDINVDSNMRTYIENVKKYLSENPDKKLVITGYADNVGNADKNRQLSEFRARFVMEQLSAKGINASRMIVEGKGSNDPMASNDTPEGRSQNRRVTIQLN